jgi:hypothetical protein
MGLLYFNRHFVIFVVWQRIPVGVFLLDTAAS